MVSLKYMWQAGRLDTQCCNLEEEFLLFWETSVFALRP